MMLPFLLQFLVCEASQCHKSLTREGPLASVLLSVDGKHLGDVFVLPVFIPLLQELHDCSIKGQVLGFHQVVQMHTLAVRVFVVVLLD